MQTRRLIKSTLPSLLLTALLPVANSDAVDLKGVVKQQLEVEKQLRSIVSDQQTPCPPAQQVSSSMKECIQALCPINADIASSETMRRQVYIEAEKRVYADFTELKDTLGEWETSAVVDMAAGLVAFKNQAATGNLEVDPALQQLHNITFLATEVGNNSIAFSAKSTADHLVVDIDQMKPKLKDLPESDQKWMLSALEGFYNLPELRRLFEIGNSSGSAILKRKYPNLSLQDALKKEADELDAAATAVAKKVTALGIPSNVFDLSVSKRMLDAARNGKFQDEASLESFLQQATLSLAFSSLVSSPEKYSWLEGRSIESIEQLMKSGVLANRANALLKYFKDQGEYKKLASTVLENCISNYSLNAVALPTDAELSSAKAQADEVIADLKSRVFTNLSTHTASMLSGVFKNVEVFFPKTVSSFKADFISSLKERTAQSQISTQFTHAHSGADGAQFALFNAYSLIGPDWSPANAVAQQLTACDGYKLGKLDDRANQAEAVFWASWLTVKNPKLGKAVMAHEMGHIMDLAMVSGNASFQSAEKYKAMEDCLIVKHPEPSVPAQTVSFQAQGQSIKFTYGQYSVEDYADQIAAIAEPDTNLGCLLVNSDDRSNPSVIHGDSSSTHSSHVFRALFSEQIRKGDIPQVCKTALTGAGTPRDFHSCLQ